jgi:hypothetical protein
MTQHEEKEIIEVANELLRQANLIREPHSAHALRQASMRLRRLTAEGKM